MEVMFNQLEIDEVISNNPSGQAGLISVLQDIERKFGYLPREILSYISEKTNIPFSNIYGVATFYEFFSLEPKGKHILKICDGTSCHSRKSSHLIEKIKNELQLTDTKHTTDDGFVTLEIVSCLGACAISPAIMFDETMHAKMTFDKIKKILQNKRNEEGEKL